jgi:hypothetical protein
VNSKLKSLRKGSLALMAGSIIAVALPATASFAATTATSTQNLTVTAGTLSVSSTTPSTVTAVVGATGSGALPSAVWSDSTGSGNGWNGTVQASDLSYNGPWMGTNAATDLTSTASGAFSDFLNGITYTVTVNSATSVTYTSNDHTDASGTVTVTAGTPVAVGTKGLTINFATLVAGDTFVAHVGTQSDNAINLATANSSSSITPFSTLYTGLPTFDTTNASATVLGGKTNATPSNSAVGTAVKFVSAALNAGMGSYTVVPGTAISADINSWAGTYTANIQYNIITGP